MATSESRIGIENPHRAERGGKFRLLTREDIRQLVATNPPAQVISVRNLAAKFGKDPDTGKIGINFIDSIFQPIQIVWVLTADGQRIKRIRDGNHRAKFFDDDQRWADHIGTPEQPGRYPTFLPEEQDLTSEVRAMFGEEPKGSGQAAISTKQYWLDILPYTKEHSDVEQQRTISHLLTEWPDAVGQDLGAKYTGLAALSMVTYVDRPIDDLTHYLTDYFAEEPEKERLIAAMLDLDQVLKNAEIKPLDARREAANLVGRETSSIGGQNEANRQILGLLSLPTVISKLTQKDVPTYRKLFFEDHVKKIIMRNFNLTFTVLVDPTYSQEQMFQIIEARNPYGVKKKIDHERAINERIEAYKTQYPNRKLTDSELSLLRKKSTLGFQTIFRAAEVITTARKRLDALPPYSPLARKLSSKIIAVERATKDKISDEIIELTITIAESAAVDHREAGTEVSEVVLLRRALSAALNKTRTLEFEVTRLLEENRQLKSALRDATDKNKPTTIFQKKDTDK